MPSGYCAYCNCFDKVTKDHIIPKCQQGKLLVYACNKCNTQKGSLSVYEWLKTLCVDSPQHKYAKRFLCMSVFQMLKFYKRQQMSLSSKKPVCGDGNIKLIQFIPGDVVEADGSKKYWDIFHVDTPSSIEQLSTCLSKTQIDIPSSVEEISTCLNKSQIDALFSVEEISISLSKSQIDTPSSVEQISTSLSKSQIDTIEELSTSFSESQIDDL